MATKVACGWAGAIFEGRSSEVKKNQACTEIGKKIKGGKKRKKGNLGNISLFTVLNHKT